MILRRCRLFLVLILFSGLLGACHRGPSLPPSPAPHPPMVTRLPPSSTPPVPTATSRAAGATATSVLPTAPPSPPPTATHPPPSPTLLPTATLSVSMAIATPVPLTATPSPPPLSPTVTYPPAGCRLGTGLRQETAAVFEAYKGRPGFVMAASSNLAEQYFPQFEGWIRVLGAPSLATLQQKAGRASQNGTPYEALGYGLETSKSTPVEEWQDLVGSTQKARDLTDQYGKLLLMGPGFRLMSRNEDKYPPMAALSDVWIIQTQRLQVNPPGPVYRQEVEKVVNQIRSGNPNISIWAQITLPPDREPDAEEWLAYRQSIVGLVDGTYIGVYTWDSADADQLAATIEAIFAAVCKSEDR